MKETRKNTKYGDLEFDQVLKILGIEEENSQYYQFQISIDQKGVVGLHQKTGFNRSSDHGYVDLTPEQQESLRKVFLKQSLKNVMIKCLIS